MQRRMEALSDTTAFVTSCRILPACRGSQARQLARLQRLEHGFDMRREIAAKVVDSGAGLLELTPVVMTLEEIFLKLVGKSQPCLRGTDWASVVEEGHRDEVITKKAAL